MNLDEKVLFSARPSLRRAYFYAVIYSAAVIFGIQKTGFDPRFYKFWGFCFALLIALLGVVYLVRLTKRYIITEQEIQSFAGILARSAIVVPVSRVTNSHLQQSFLERILGLVNLYIDSAGGEAKELVFARILKSEAKQAMEIMRGLRSKKVNAEPENLDTAI